MASADQPPAETPAEHRDLRQTRIDKLEKLAADGIPLWPDRYERTHTLEQAQKLEPGTKDVRLAGRVKVVRPIGGNLIFAVLQDLKGSLQIQLTKKDEAGEILLEKEHLTRFKKLVDMGDHVGVLGDMIVTKTGELTLRVREWTFLGKALRPLPAKWEGHQLADTETRLRQRYLDLIMNKEVRERFMLRTEIVRTIRTFLDEHGFDEVETPILTTIASGAAARKFETHHNALDLDVALRIAPETYLKRLIVGGYDRVYEFARCFRNEGMDPSHLQDFTMLEYYCAWWNYEDNMDFTEKLVKHTIGAVTGGLTVQRGERTLDFSAERWPRVAIRDLILRDAGIDIAEHRDTTSLRAAITDRQIAIDRIEHLGRGALVDALYKKVSRPKLIDPIFLIKHPTDLSPLARRNDDDPDVVDRFQLVVNGWEVVNAYSELVDPIDQRQRLEEQSKLRAAGDDEAMPLDEDYLLAMEYGMPPISGWGMGIDRFVALITNQDSLRETVLFPLMRPEV